MRVHKLNNVEQAMDLLEKHKVYLEVYVRRTGRVWKECGGVWLNGGGRFLVEPSILSKREGLQTESTAFVRAVLLFKLHIKQLHWKFVAATGQIK